MPPEETSKAAPHTEVAENQTPALTLDVLLPPLEKMIVEIFIMHLTPIATALRAHSTRLEAQQELLDRLVTQSDDRSSSSSSEDLDDPTPTVGRRERTPSAHPGKDHHYMPFVPSRHETWAPIRPFPPSGTDGTIPPPPVGMPAPSIGPFADDLAHYLAPLKRQTIREYMPGGGGPPYGGPPGGGPPGGGPPGGGPPGGGPPDGGPPDGGPPGGGGWWHGHYAGSTSTAGLTERPAKYSGEPGENAEFWFHQLDRYFNANRVMDNDIKGDILLSFLAGEAHSFYYHSMRLNGGFPLTYHQIRHAFIKKFEEDATSTYHKREMLHHVQFHSVARLQEYVAEFRRVENEIFDMNYADRLDLFIEQLPHECRMHILTTPGIRQAGDMELAYRVARDWAASAMYSRHLDRRQPANTPHGEHHRRPPPTVRATPVATIVANQTLDKPEEELDVIDEKTAEGYKCGKIGHFARSCKHPPKSRSSTAGRKPTRKTRFGSSTLYQLEVEGGDSESGPDEEEEKDSYYYDGDYVDENHTPDRTEYLNLIATYELDTDMVLAVDSNTDMEHMLTGLVASSSLPRYDVDINGADAKLVIDSGATTQFIR